MRRRWIIAAAALSIVLAALLAWSTGEGIFDIKSSRSAARDEPTVSRVEASGELRSSDSVNVGCPQLRRVWDFTVVHMAPEGKAVPAGHPLLSFDTQKLQERLELRNSRLETARKEFEKTLLETQEKLEKLVLEEVELKAKEVRIARMLNVPVELQERLELEKLHIEAELVTKELKLASARISIQEVNKAARNGSAERRVKSLEREVSQLAEQIEKMTVKATRPGFVVHVASDGGEKVKIGESVWYGKKIMEIADLEKMEIAAEIAERDAGLVAEGQVAEIRLDAAPERVFTGRIIRLGKIFRTKSWQTPTKVFDAVISIDNPDAELMRPGMAASVEVLVAASGPSKGSDAQPRGEKEAS